MSASIALYLIAEATLAANATSGSPCGAPTTFTRYPVSGAIGSQWNAETQTLSYGRPRADGHYAVYVNDASGSRERQVHYSMWPDDRHEFPVAWHPSGRYLMVTVEEADHPGNSVNSIPGYGAYSNYWLVTPDGRRAWRMTDLPRDRDHAITHAAFSPDGSRFVWTERIGAPRLSWNLLAGSYQFNVSQFVDDDAPHLGDTINIVPENRPQGGEVESIAPDNRTIAFYSTLRSGNLIASRIYTMDIETHSILELTRDSFAQAPRFTPDGQQIVYMSGADSDLFPFSLQGADWWIMDRDGGHKQRLTFMNKRNHFQSENHYRLAGSLSFSSDHAFYGDVMTKSFGLTGYILQVQIHSECLGRR